MTPGGPSHKELVIRLSPSTRLVQSDTLNTLPPLGPRAA